MRSGGNSDCYILYISLILYTAYMLLYFYLNKNGVNYGEISFVNIFDHCKMLENEFVIYRKNIFNMITFKILNFYGYFDIFYIIPC